MNEEGPLGTRSRLRKIAHIVFWTLLFYLLAYGIGKLLEILRAKMM